MNGKIIVIDGMDGTGKATQSELLFKKLKEKNNKVKLFSFPNYDEESSYFIKKYLREGYCRDLESEVPILHDFFYSIDRCISYHKNIKQYYEDGYIIILDRYIIANPICNLHKYGEETSSIVKYLTRLTSVENHFFEIPKPDVNIILYSKPVINTKLIADRASKENDTPDLNESLTFQTNVFNNIEKIDPDLIVYTNNLGKIEKLLVHDKKGNMYSVEDMHEQIMKVVEKYI